MNVEDMKRLLAEVKVASPEDAARYVELAADGLDFEPWSPQAARDAGFTEPPQSITVTGYFDNRVCCGTAGLAHEPWCVRSQP